MKIKIENKSTLIIIALLVLIVVLILRPRLVLTKVNNEAETSCTKPKTISNPKYDEELELWISKCIKTKKEKLPRGICYSEATINHEIKEPITTVIYVEGTCSQVESIKQTIWLQLFSSDTIKIKLFSSTKKVNVSNSEIDSVAASKIVMDIPEVKEFFKLSPNPHLTIDNMNDKSSFWNIHVYEDFPDHTVTFNWYEVDKKTGSFTSRVTIESNR